MKRLMFLVSCVAAFSNLYAQNSEDMISIINRIVPNTVDIRSIGMGKTEVAANSGSNALFTNPSLLALQEKGSIKLGSALHIGFFKDESIDQISDLYDTEVKYGYKPSFKFTNISFSLPFHIQTPSVPISFAFGTGYQNAIDLSFTQYNEQEQQGTNGKIYNNYKTKYTGGLNTITPGFSFGVLDRISAGISFNIGFGNMKSKSTSEYKTISGKEENETIITATGKAFYPTFGISGKPLQNMTIGLSISPSYEWEWDDIEREIEDDEGDESYDLEGGEFTLPPKFSIGMEYQITPKFSFAIEYQSRPFNSFEFDADGLQGARDLGSFESHIDSMDLKNGHVLHVGTEILAGKAPLRFGFFLEPYAITDDELTNSGNTRYDETPNYLMGGTFGLGIPIGEAAFIDAAAQYGRLKTTHESFNTNARKTKYDEIHHLIRVDLGVKIALPSINIKKAASAGTTSPSKPQSNFNSSPALPSQQVQPDYQTPQYNQETYPSYQQTPPAIDYDSGYPTDQGSYKSDVPVFENQNSGF